MSLREIWSLLLLSNYTSLNVLRKAGARGCVSAESQRHNCKVDNFSVVYVLQSRNRFTSIDQVGAQGTATILSQPDMIKELFSLWPALMEQTGAGVGRFKCWASQPDCRFRFVFIQNCCIIIEVTMETVLILWGYPTVFPPSPSKTNTLPCKALLGLGQGLVTARSQGSPRHLE